MKASVCQVNKTQAVILWGSYLSYVLFIPAFFGCAVSHFKSKQYEHCLGRVEVANKTDLNLLASHHHWLIRTFIFVSVLVMAGMGTLFYGVGYLITIVALVWWFVRVFQGIWFLALGKAMPGWKQG
ncbi:MAG: hypothetical protein OEZ68_20270 [Gammaproteobacteria bacterium]|nr:hypothetical protein [Gammaproteobacteria bacterium]MDH5803140.1 hypothetical protein [Gammaproteobacteria bacterium]